MPVHTYLFLLHELCVGTIIYHILAENGSSQRAVYFFRIEILMLPIQDEVIPFDSQANSSFPSKQDEGEDIAILWSN